MRSAARGYREPRTDTEIRLAGLYREIFGLLRVGADDSFFELGGHSLLANRLALRLRTEFGVKIDMRTLCETPTVVGLAALIEDAPVAAPDVLTADDRRRVLGEWATGVEVPEVPGVADLIRRGRAIPDIRTMIHCGDETCTYGELFAGLDTAVLDMVSEGASIARLVRLLATLGVDAGCGIEVGGAPETVLLPDSALAVAVADRRAVAAERRCGRRDPAYGSADVRLIAANWSDAQVAVELLAALADGATLVVATESQLANPDALVELIVQHAVSHVVATTHTVAGIAAAELPTILRWDITGTDSTAALSGRLASVSAGSVATIAYGTPGYAGVVARGLLDGTGRIRPIPGARVLILDESCQPVPPGVIGDVYVGGAALGFGDVGGRATDRFVVDPFLPAGRLLRTGDRGSWTSEGWLVIA
ncbi:AMP-binding protein [Nocardia sp. NBC_00881]|uniref:phosphopantetheine-binding protein n=1 Tax=Nocardia sp. NBC_00881 TaxID=2975995 RepID=UPI00386BDC26|nr:AMP-binding protein [Nocardia sp. NBC_00881]